MKWSLWLSKVNLHVCTVHHFMEYQYTDQGPLSLYTDKQAPVVWPTCGTVGVCPALLTLTQVWAINVLTGAPIPTRLHRDTLVHIYSSIEREENLSGTKFGSVCYISFKNCLINVFCINCFIVIHLFPSTVQQKKKKPWAVLNVALYAISISSIIWLMCIDKKN